MGERMPLWAGSASALLLVLSLGSFVAAGLPATESSTAPSPRSSAPDLVPTGLAFTPNPVQEDDVIQLDVTIENRGDIAAWMATVTLVDARPNGDVQLIPGMSLSAPLPPGGSIVLKASPYVAVGAGNHTVTVRLSDILPTDANATNNVRSFAVAVEPRLDNPPPPSTSDGVGIEALQRLGIGGLVVVVILAIAGWAIGAPLRRPREESLVPPPPEPPDRRPPPIWPP